MCSQPKLTAYRKGLSNPQEHGPKHMYFWSWISDLAWNSCLPFPSERYTLFQSCGSRGALEDRQGIQTEVFYCFEVSLFNLEVKKCISNSIDCMFPVLFSTRKLFDICLAHFNSFKVVIEENCYECNSNLVRTLG